LFVTLLYPSFGDETRLGRTGTAGAEPLRSAA
jgi:hypothetical protein